jgi:hypothetical protein
VQIMAKNESNIFLYIGVYGIGEIVRAKIGGF